MRTVIMADRNRTIDAVFAMLANQRSRVRAGADRRESPTGKIGQMAASAERHLPANMVSYFLAQARGRDPVQEAQLSAVGMSSGSGAYCECRATDSQETSCLSPRTGYRFGSHS